MTCCDYFRVICPSGSANTVSMIYYNYYLMNCGAIVYVNFLLLITEICEKNDYLWFIILFQGAICSSMIFFVLDYLKNGFKFCTQNHCKISNLTCHLNIRRLDDETKLQYMHTKWQMLLLIVQSIQIQYGLWICKRKRDNDWQKSLFKDFCRLKLYFSYQCRIRLPLALSVLFLSVSFKSFCARYHRKLW